MQKSLVRKLIGEGYNSIYIVELTGKTDQAVLIDVEKIKIIEHNQSTRTTPPRWGIHI